MPFSMTSQVGVTLMIDALLNSCETKFARHILAVIDDEYQKVSGLT